MQFELSPKHAYTKTTFTLQVPIKAELPIKENKPGSVVGAAVVTTVVGASVLVTMVVGAIVVGAALVDNSSGRSKCT